MPAPAPRFTRWIAATVVTVGYGLAAVILTWPLAGHLTNALLGDPAGDTGVYVWNLWIFRHELVRHAHIPFSTDHIFAYTGAVDFSLHNYTPLSGLVGVLLVPWLGVVGAFNVALLTFLTTSGIGVFLLARQIGLRAPSAWTAGVLFIAAPLVTARETAHLSLVTNAALPLFVWALLRTFDRPRLGGGVLVGCLVAVAAYSDAYYGVYCVIMGAFLLAWRFLRLERKGSAATRSRAIRAIDVACLIIAAIVVWQVVSRTTVFFIGPVRVTVSLYNPMLVLVLLGGLRAWLTWRPSLRVEDRESQLRALLGPGIVAIGVCLALLTPILAGLASRYAQGRLPDVATYWRSSPRGVDLLAYVVPNPNHTWFGLSTERWLLPPAADAFPELVASFSLLALAAIAVAAWRRVLPRMWVAFTAVFVLLSLGPFIHVGGVNTFVIGPWALLRYVPVLSMARAPSRFAIVAAMGLSLLFGFALDAWLASGDRRRTIAAGVLGLLIALEVVPGQRRLFSAEVPEVYRLIATVDSRDEQSHLLELPAGVRDGTSSIGDFNASTEFFQTIHRRPLVGGYLSRVSESRKRENLQSPVLRALYALSERPGPLSDDWVVAARRSRDAFFARSCVAYVIVDKRRASIDLQTFARDVLNLVSVHDDDRYELLTPLNKPACEPRPPDRARKERRTPVER